MERREKRMERAKELFYKYHGNRFYMDHDGVGREYDSYHIPREREEKWAEELISDFLASNPRGKEALRLYSAVTELTKPGRDKDNWNRCLYYPLRAGQLDDVTILFMLPLSFRMAEKAARKACFSGEDAALYLNGLEACAAILRVRGKEGTLTRAEDYVMNEFSDPVYVADYLNSLKTKWKGLLHETNRAPGGKP